MTWLSTARQNWQVKPLRHAVRLNPEVLEEATSPDFTFRYVDISSVNSLGEIGSTERIRFAAAPSRARRVVRPGDTIISTVRTYLKAVATIEPSEEPLVASTGFAVLRPGPDVDARFLWRLIQSEGFVQSVVAHSDGVGYPAIAPSRLGSLPILLPPLPEQRAISAFLDRQTVKIDELIAKKERLIALLQEQRAAVITHAVTRGLDPNAPMKDSGVEWLGQVPKHWAVRRIKQVAKMDSGHTPDKAKPEYWDGGTVPWVSLNDTAHLRRQEWITDTAVCTTPLGLANSSAHLLPPDSVVFSRDATIGRCAITTRPMAVSQHFIAWICGVQLLPRYLLQVLRSSLMQQELMSLTMGSTVKTIGMPDVKSLVTPVPPLDEQAAIIVFLDRAKARIDRLDVEVRAAIDRLREYRSALISAAVTGKIDVRGEVE